MGKFLIQKKTLIERVFEKASNETTEKSFSGITKYLERTLLDDYNIQLAYKTFETYYKSIVENGKDYNIKPLILDNLSMYLEYQNFKDFCINIPDNLRKSGTKVNILIDDDKETSLSEKFSNIIINITNSPIFTLPEFVAKHSNSFGLLGILLIAGFIFKKTDIFKENDTKNVAKKDSVSYIFTKETKSDVTTPKTFVNIVEVPKAVQEKTVFTPERKKECMYWNDDHYEEIFCDEHISGKTIIALNEDTKLLKKITSPDTLTAENAVGKIWYDKTGNKVEFFTHYGVHPENGKTLKLVTEYMIAKYAKKSTKM